MIAQSFSGLLPGFEGQELLYGVTLVASWSRSSAGSTFFGVLDCEPRSCRIAVANFRDITDQQSGDPHPSIVASTRGVDMISGQQRCGDERGIGCETRNRV